MTLAALVVAGLFVPAGAQTPPIEAGIDSHRSREISTFCRSFCSASFSNSADSPPQKMSASGLPFHSTIRP